MGWYIIAYGFGIYILNLLISFLSPFTDPEDEDSLDLPMNNDKSGEYKPFIRKLPEFKFWYSITKALVISILLTITRFTDIPVFWPILLGYFILLFLFTMKDRIKHMIKYKYVPFNVGKKTYSEQKTSEPNTRANTYFNKNE